MYQDSVSAEPGTQPGETGETSPADVSAEFDQTADSEIADPHESSHAFRDELARAMHAAAEHERLRIEATVDEDATAHIEKVRSRAVAEAGELKRLAEDDVTGIRGWAKSEIERIRADADVQISDRRERLEQHLVSHATIIDGEVDRVSEAIEGYRHELATFFARLSEEGDPTEIARLADTVPGPPDFEVIRAVARAEAVDRLSRLDDDGSSSAASSAGVSGEAEVAATAAPSEAAAETAEDGPELVAVMDPALAQSDDASAPEATADVAADEPAGDEQSAVAEAAPAEVPVADMAATAGEPAEGDEAAESSEPVAVAAGSSDSNPATRFIRSLTSWGSGDHASGDQPK
jgi:hypothetical protein